MIISQAEAARLLGFSRAAISKMISRPPRPAFFVDMNGSVMVDTEHPDWVAKLKNPKGARRSGKISSGKKRKSAATTSSLAVKNLKGGRYFTGALRQAVLERDGHRCIKCGKTPADGVRLEVDHIQEFEDGGETVYDNGQTLCSECNKGKSAKKKISKTDEYISLTEFGKRVSAHRNSVADAIKAGRIEADQVTGKINYTTEIVKWFQAHTAIKPPQSTTPDILPDVQDLYNEAAIAAQKEIIFSAKIKEEKAKQEEIKTAEIKKGLAPMYLVKHFFTFGETMVHRGFRRYHEIIPELKALFLAGKDQEAELLLTREQEVIVRDTQRDLIKAIEDEGYSADM